MIKLVACNGNVPGLLFQGDHKICYGNSSTRICSSPALLGFSSGDKLPFMKV